MEYYRFIKKRVAQLQIKKKPVIKESQFAKDCRNYIDHQGDQPEALGQVWLTLVVTWHSKVDSCIH